MKTTAAEQVEHLLDLARAHLDLHQTEGALQIVRHILSAHPDHLGARVVGAKAHVSSDQPLAALEQLDAAELHLNQDAKLAGEAERMELLILRACCLAGLEQGDEALAVLQSAHAMDASEPTVLHLLASMHAQRGEADAAIPYLKALLDLHPDDADVLRRLADAYQMIRCPDLALGLYKRLDELNRVSTHVPVYGGTTSAQACTLRVARLNQMTHHVVDAVDAFDGLMRANPDDADLAAEAGALAIEMGDDEKARRYLAQALGSNPRHRMAVGLLAEQHLRCGRFGAAAAAYFRGYRLDRSAEALAGLVVSATAAGRATLSRRAHRRLGRLVMSRSQRRRHLAAAWQHAMPGLLLDDLVHRRHHPASAEVLPRLLEDSARILEASSQLLDEQADLHYHLGVCRNELGRPDQAAQALDRALRINHSYVAAARLRIGLLLAEANYPAAEALLESQHQLKPRLTELTDLAIVLTFLRDGGEAARRQLQMVSAAGADRQMLANRVTEFLSRFDEGLAPKWIEAVQSQADGKGEALSRAA